LQGLLFQVDVSEIIVHEGDEPNTLVDLLDAELLASQDCGEIDLLGIHADAPAFGDDEALVMEGVFEIGAAAVGAR
jgi:hypothetical protein